MMISKSKLIPLLIHAGFIENESRVSFEAYGRKVMAYVALKDMAERKRLESFLKERKIRFNPRYSPGAAVAEVQVSFFRAFHWDE